MYSLAGRISGQDYRRRSPARTWGRRPVVLKFDRPSRSIRHFCELYERYFKGRRRKNWSYPRVHQVGFGVGASADQYPARLRADGKEATGERDARGDSGNILGQRLPLARCRMARGRCRLPTTHACGFSSMMRRQVRARAAQRRGRRRESGSPRWRRRLNDAGTKPPQGSAGPRVSS